MHSFLRTLSCALVLLPIVLTAPTGDSPHPVYEEPTVDDSLLIFGDLKVSPGQKVREDIHVNLGYVSVDIPVILINGARPGPKKRVVLTSGVHGGEFVGNAAAFQLANELDPKDVRGQIVISPMVNPPAVLGGRLAVSPLDRRNMNRVFPGDENGSPTERLAAWVFKNLIVGADAYADLHSGGIDETLTNFIGYRETSDKALDEKTHAMAMAVGIQDVIASKDTKNGNSVGNSHGAAAAAGIPSILVEVGELGKADSLVVRTMVDGLYHLLHHLEVLDLPPNISSPTGAPREWVWKKSTFSPANGFWHVDPEATTGKKVSKGQIIGYVDDPSGAEKHMVVAEDSGTVFYGMNGMNGFAVTAGDELAAVAVVAAAA